jgi:aspartokinase
VIAVVSAFGDTTNQLIRRAERVCEQPDKSVLPGLLATGEAAASALLTLALNKVGIPACPLDEVQAKLRTVSGTSDAIPVSVDTARLLAESRRAVVVFPGFVGRDEAQNRRSWSGGSDLTALFLAQQLKAQCVLIKDVDGLYTSDPAHRRAGVAIAQVSYDTAIRLGGRVVKLRRRALRLPTSLLQHHQHRISSNRSWRFPDRLRGAASFRNHYAAARLRHGRRWCF